MKQALKRALKQIEWPTLWLIIGVYFAWLVVTMMMAHNLTATDPAGSSRLWQFFLPACALALLIAKHSSLQHEVIHGHPTRSQWLNSLLAGPALGLLLPFRRFEDLHLKHHRDWLLTDPFDDTESYFLSEAQWQALSRPYRALLQANNTLIGRLLLGPWIMYARFYRSEIRLLRQDAPGVRAAWSLHLAGLLPVLAWLSWIDFPVLLYLLGAVWPATSLLLLRSYAEHVPVIAVTDRSAIVETNPLLGLLYLNNNLHRVHHDDPSLPWYRIPARYRERYARSLSDTAIKGYSTLFAMHVMRASYPVVHPILRREQSSSAQAEPSARRNQLP